MKVNRIRELYRDDGIAGVFKAILRMIYWNTGIIHAHRRLAYWQHQGNIKHNIDGTSAEFRITNYTEFVRFRNLMWEKPILEDLLSEIRVNDVFYDIGANVGLYSCFISKHTETIAFEPHPDNLNHLEKNTNLNHVDIRILPVALSSKTGTAELTIDADIPGAGKHTLTDNYNDRSMSVDVERGDNVPKVYSVSTPTVLKIDVEGAELDVLRGMSGVLSECRLIYCEVHPDRLSNFDASVRGISEFFQAHGFACTRIGDRKNEYFVKAVKDV